MDTVFPNAIKTLANNNLAHLLNGYNSFFTDKKDYKEWHENQVYPLPTAGKDATDLNNWMGIYLMDIGAK